MTNPNQALPPKTCTIERLVTVEADIEKVLDGKKTATRRNRRYADIGEIMTLQDSKYIVVNVYAQTLGEMTDSDAISEGYRNLEEYKRAILALHPGMPWSDKMRVWVHEFKPNNG